MIKKDKSSKMIYSFTISKWFYINSDSIKNENFSRECSNRGMLIIPSNIATNSTMSEVRVTNSDARRGVTNQLWPEWGNGAFGPYAYLTSDKNKGNKVVFYGLNGSLYSLSDSSPTQFIYYR